MASERFRNDASGRPRTSSGAAILNRDLPAGFVPLPLRCSCWPHTCGAGPGPGSEGCHSGGGGGHSGTGDAG